MPTKTRANAGLILRRSSLPDQIAQLIRAEFQCGRWGGRLPAERTLCEELQVSRTSLRAALLQLETEGMLRSAQGRRRELADAPLKEPDGEVRAISIKMLCPMPLDRIEPFVLIEIEYIREWLSRRNWSFQTLFRPACFSRRPQRSLESEIQQSPADLWLLWRSIPEVQRWFLDRDLPHVVLGSAFWPERTPSVDLAHAATAQHAATTLARLGHRRGAIIVHQGQTAGDLASIEGFTVQERAPFCQGVEVAAHDGAPSSIRRCLDRLLALQPRPTALFSAGGAQTITIVSYLRDLGLQIPRDVSLISRDDDPALEFLSPVVARYRREPAKLARSVVKQIQARLASGWTKARPMLIFPELFRGATLAKAPAI